MSHRTFLFFISLALIIDLGKRFGVLWPKLIHNYLNDFLYIPLVAFFIQWLVRKWKALPHFKLSISHLLFLVLMNSFYFEYYLPKINDRYTADVFDILAYAMGAFLFWFLNHNDEKV